MDGIIEDESLTTINKVRIVAGTQQIVRVDEEEIKGLPGKIEDRVIEYLKGSVDDIGAVAVSDYAKGFVTPRIMNLLHDISRMHGIPVLVDPKPVNVDLYRGVDLIKPNLKEISEITGIGVSDDESCDRAAEKLITRISPRALLLTRGAGGMSLYRRDAEKVRITAKVSRVYDVSGAGDTVLAALSMAYSVGTDPVDACEFAAAAASVVVTKPGTSTVTPEELLNNDTPGEI